jgi:hypothetical protein
MSNSAMVTVEEVQVSSLCKTKTRKIIKNYHDKEEICRNTCLYIGRANNLGGGNAIDSAPAGVNTVDVLAAAALQGGLVGTAKVVAQVISIHGTRSSGSSRVSGRGPKRLDQLSGIAEVVVLGKATASTMLLPLVSPELIVIGVGLRVLHIRPPSGHSVPSDFHSHVIIEFFIGAKTKQPEKYIRKYKYKTQYILTKMEFCSISNSTSYRNIPGVSSRLVLRPQPMNSEFLIPQLLRMLTTIVTRLVMAKLGLPAVGKHYK